MTSIPISVVMATYNGERYLQEQMDSILQQTILPAQIIVCDDGSTDGTIAILKSYQDKGLIQLYVNDTKLGVVENFKKAVSLATEGNDIALSDQDDIWLPHKLATLQKALRKLEYTIPQSNETPCIVYSDLTLVDENKNVINTSFWNQLNHHVHEHCLQTLLFGNFVTGLSVMLNEATKKHFKTIPQHILHDVWLAFVGNTIGAIQQVNEPLALYRQHDQNVNYQKGNYKPTQWQHRVQRLKNIFSNKPYLQHEYFIADAFLKVYKFELSQQDQKMIQSFLATANWSYLMKEIALKWFFRGKWKK